MAAVDALSLGDGDGSRDYARWIVGGAFALALHAGLLITLDTAPQPVGFESQAPIELDLLPPPSGAAQMDEAGADSPAVAAEETAPVEPSETLDEIVPDDASPPDVTAEVPPDQPPETVRETPPDETVAVEPEVETPVRPEIARTLETPPDVQAAVTVPAEEVTAREEQVEPPKPPQPVVKRDQPRREPPPKPVARREEPKPAPKPAARRELPMREAAKPQERPAPNAKPAETVARAQSGAQAGGRAGASDDAGAARADAAAYKSRVFAAVAAQRRPQNNLVGRALVTITLNRAGRIVSLSASGPSEAAAEAQAMVRRASFPPFSPAYTAPTATYTVPVNFFKPGGSR